MKRTVTRNAQLLRVLQIIRDLDRMGGVDLYELAERYGTSVRTIRRDFDALTAAGLPVTEVGGGAGEARGGGQRKAWHVAYDDKLARLARILDAGHYLALRAVMGGGTLGRATSLFAALEDLCCKIEQALGPRERARLIEIERAFHSRERFAWRQAPPEVLWPLVEAIAGKRICAITYRTPGTKPPGRRFRILPLRLFSHDGALYLHAVAVTHDDVITLNLHRLSELTVTAEHGEPPAGFDPERHEASAFGIFTSGEPTHFRLRFEAWAAPYIRERVWHPSQVLRDLPGGRVELAFTCADNFEVTAWVASWREAVEVAQPASLRDELRDLGAWYVGRYGTPASAVRKRRAA